MKLLLDGQIIEVPDEEPNIAPDEAKKQTIYEIKSHYEDIQYKIDDLTLHVSVVFGILLVGILTYLISRYRTVINLHNRTKENLSALKNGFRRSIKRSLLFMLHTAVAFGWTIHIISTDNERLLWTISILIIDECLFLSYAIKNALGKRKRV